MGRNPGVWRRPHHNLSQHFPLSQENSAWSHLGIWFWWTWGGCGKWAGSLQKLTLAGAEDERDLLIDHRNSKSHCNCHHGHLPLRHAQHEPLASRVLPLLQHVCQLQLQNSGGFYSRWAHRDRVQEGRGKRNGPILSNFHQADGISSESVAKRDALFAEPQSILLALLHNHTHCRPRLPFLRYELHGHVLRVLGIRVKWDFLPVPIPRS